MNVLKDVIQAHNKILWKVFMSARWYVLLLLSSGVVFINVNIKKIGWKEYASIVIELTWERKNIW